MTKMCEFWWNEKITKTKKVAESGFCDPHLPWDLWWGCVMALQRGRGAGAVDMAVAESGNTHLRRRGIVHCPVLMNKSWG